MKAFFEELFAYSHHYNQQLADIFITRPELVSKQSVAIFNHILNAHQTWNSRLLQKAPLYGVWEIHPNPELKRLDASNYKDTAQILESADLESVMNYTNTKGQAFTNKTRDILFHVINHSTYHRGQIATALRQSGIEPVDTDYIFYKR